VTIRCATPSRSASTSRPSRPTPSAAWSATRRASPPRARNPYGKFVADARAQLGGKDPAEIALEELTLTLGAGSTGVTRLGEVFTGQVDVLFVMNDTNNTAIAGGGVIAATEPPAGPRRSTASFTSTTLGAADLAKVIAGSFKVVIRGPAGADFETKGADADLQLTLTFAAYE
jgi:hypothetical protein